MDSFDYAICHYLALRHNFRNKVVKNNNNLVRNNNKPVINNNKQVIDKEKAKLTKVEKKRLKNKERKRRANILKGQLRQRESRARQYQALAEAAQKKEQEEKEWQEKKEQMRIEKEKEEAERIKKEELERKIKIEKIDNAEDNEFGNQNVGFNTPVKKLIVSQETQTEDTTDFLMSVDVHCKPSFLDYPEEKGHVFSVYKVIPITFPEPVKATLILHHKDPRRTIFRNYDYSEKQLPDHLSPKYLFSDAEYSP